VSGAGIPTGFGQADLDLLALLRLNSEGLRTGLATLARIGVRWRRAEPERCRSWIGQVESHPFYKAGQTLFDLFEFEDFMLDGPAAEDAGALGDLLAKLASISGMPAVVYPLPTDLPELEGGFYLYRDVVLGLLTVLLETGNLSRIVR
jgi:hypothetical protein